MDSSDSDDYYTPMDSETIRRHCAVLDRVSAQNSPKKATHSGELPSSRSQETPIGELSSRLEHVRDCDVVDVGGSPNTLASPRSCRGKISKGKGKSRMIVVDISDAESASDAEAVFRVLHETDTDAEDNVPTSVESSMDSLLPPVKKTLSGNSVLTDASSAPSSPKKRSPDLASVTTPGSPSKGQKTAQSVARAGAASPTPSAASVSSSATVRPSFLRTPSAGPSASTFRPTGVIAQPQFRESPMKTPNRPSRQDLFDDMDNPMGPSFSPGPSPAPAILQRAQSARSPFTTSPVKFTLPTRSITAPQPTTPSRGVTRNPVTPQTPMSPDERRVRKLAQGPFSIDLEVFHIGKETPRAVLKWLDEYRIAWGAQYQLARGVSIGDWSWGDVTQKKLKSLRGTNSEAAPEVRRIMSVKPETPEAGLWTELDLEQDAIMEDRGRGLGLLGSSRGSGEKDWYGGKIQQIARLDFADDSDESDEQFALRLEPMEKKRSNRYARYVGSRRILQIKISAELLRKNTEDAVFAFFQRRFVICGRVFMPFMAKEGCVYLVEVKDTNFRFPKDHFGDHHVPHYKDFLAWHNPIELNFNQPISKFMTRWALGGSDSIPVLEFASENIIYIADIVSTAHTYTDSKPPAEMVMTDGCGLINAVALTAICKRMGYEIRPPAVQGRIAGAKGLWILNEEDTSPEPKIWIRDSQNKIQLQEPLDRAHRIFDLVAPSTVKNPTRLSMQSVINLTHNGVPHQVLIDLIEKQMEEEVGKLTEWKSPKAMELLWDAVNKAKRVSAMRAQRYSPGKARVLGLAGRSFGPDKEENPWVVMGHETLSGKPVSKAEEVLELLQAGYHPMHSQYLYDALSCVHKDVVNAFLEDYHITVPESFRAFIAPDPLGLLKEGQIHFRPSKSFVNPTTGALVSRLKGMVLVGRSPMCTPPDIQKLEAIVDPRYDEYYDVVLMSTEGSVSAASKNSGGDYDGDEVEVIMQKEIVTPFTTAHPISVDPRFVQDNFHQEIEMVVDFATNVHSLSHADAQKRFLKAALHGLANTNVGMYSNFHGNATYAYGYDHPESIRLGRMFEKLLDASKSGLRVKEEVLASDKLRFDRGRPRCMQTDEDEANKASPSEWAKPPIPRQKKLPPFVLDELRAAGKRFCDMHLRQFDLLRQESSNMRQDVDLLRPIEEASALATFEGHPGSMRELVVVEQFVKAHHDEYKEIYTRTGSPSKKKLEPDESKSTERVLALVREFHAGPPVKLVPWLALQPRLLTQLKASYAYKACWYKGSACKYAYKMAFRQMCDIKASGPEGSRVIMKGSFAGAMAMDKGSVRMFTQSREEA